MKFADMLFGCENLDMVNRFSRFPLAVQQWVEGVLGAEARIVSAQRLRGGLSSVVHKLTIDRRSEVFGVVLKRRVVDDGEPATQHTR
jgi:hypothetical protein